MFKINLVEIFGKVFGLKYVYHFLHVHNIIDDDLFKKMSENIHFLEYEFMVKCRKSLWQMMFIFEWPQLYLKDPHQIRCFQIHLGITLIKVEENLNNYLRFS